MVREIENYWVFFILAKYVQCAWYSYFQSKILPQKITFEPSLTKCGIYLIYLCSHLKCTNFHSFSR